MTESKRRFFCHWCSSHWLVKKWEVSSILCLSYFSFKYSFLFASMSSLLALASCTLKIVLNDLSRICRMLVLFRTELRSSFFEILAFSESEDKDSSVVSNDEVLSLLCSMCLPLSKEDSNKLSIFCSENRLFWVNFLFGYSFNSVLCSSTRFLSCPIIPFCCFLNSDSY